MVTLTFAPVFPANTRLSAFEHNTTLSISKRKSKKKNNAIVPVARLFGPAIFEASKLKVLFLGVDEKKHPGKLPRAYTLTHSDVTSKLTLAISHSINNSQLQGWANKIYRDEVVAEWKKVKGNMSLHVHCHISGGHFLLDLCARLRYFIFSKELPVVLKAFVHGDGNLLKNYPELQESLVWVYFHSNVPEFNRLECWGPLAEAAAPSTAGDDEWQCQEGEKQDDEWRCQEGEKQQVLAESKLELLQPCQEGEKQQVLAESKLELPQPCQDNCNCCFPTMSLIPWSSKHPHHNEKPGTQTPPIV